jgi:hypothetical protein
MSAYENAVRALRARGMTELERDEILLPLIAEVRKECQIKAIGTDAWRLRSEIEFYMLDGCASEEGARSLLDRLVSEVRTATLRKAADICDAEPDVVSKLTSYDIYDGAYHMGEKLRRMAERAEGE